ncbi:zinc finger protein Xfin-like [Cheilinus undulatus]|uniref:zinc finger protein Xfin-like n=1 Tax=Cheilinus undulatus TaxID=241271 RepID=UPI001BD3134A|nr:zinc finger protein Xfin-like [Cheilinus undulatus]
MCQVSALRALVEERLSAAVEEIFRAVETMRRMKNTPEMLTDWQKAAVQKQLSEVADDICKMLEVMLGEYEPEVPDSNEEGELQLLDITLETEADLYTPGRLSRLDTDEDISTEQQRSIDTEVYETSHQQITDTSTGTDSELIQSEPLHFQQTQKIEKFASSVVETTVLLLDSSEAETEDSDCYEDLNEDNDVEGNNCRDQNNETESSDGERQEGDSDEEWRASEEAESNESGEETHIRPIRKKHEPDTAKDIKNKDSSLVKYSCKVCSRSFCHRASFVKHVKKLESDKDTCGVCGKHFESKESLRLHLQTYSETTDCEVCGRQCDGPKHLEMHMRTHTGEKPYICRMCGKAFSLKGTLMTHVRIHTGEKPYICSICGKAYATNVSLKAHKSRVHTGVCVCSMCGESFRQTEVSGQSPNLCKDCGNHQENSESLKAHSNIDSEEDINLIQNSEMHMESCDAEHESGTNDESKESEGAVIQAQGSAKQEDPENMDLKYSCKVCGRSFCHRASFVKHVKKFESDKDTCGVCGRHFESKESLRLHLQTYSETTDCEVCGRQCDGPKHLEMHMRTHTGEKPYICRMCGKAFSLKGTLLTHERIHTGEKPYICRICGKAYATNVSLKAHKSRVHTGVCVCSMCGESFRQTEGSGQSPILCKDCGNHQENSDSLKAHSNIDSEEDINLIQNDEMHMQSCDAEHESGTNDESKESEGAVIQAQGSAKQKDPENMDLKYSCKVCGRSFCHRASFLKHVNKYEKDEDVCGVCGKHFESKESLRLHLQSHIQTNNCDVCGKQFNSPKHLEMHMRTHTGQKPYICSVCWKAFCQKGNLQRHMQVHTKEKPYSCDVCGEACATNKTLNKHIKSHTRECVCNMCGLSFRQSLGSGQNSELCENCSESQDSEKQNAQSEMEIQESVTQNLTDDRHTESNDAESEAGSNDDESKESGGLVIHSQSSVKPKGPENVEGKYCCKVCGRCFCQRASFLKHVKKVEDEKDICGVCGIPFQSIESLKLHLQSYTETSECGVCGRQCDGPKHLEMHMRSHTGEKPYMCSVCERSFALKGTLMAHMRVHTKKKPYSCDACGKAFSRNESLKMHMRVHTKECVCNMCGQSFRQNQGFGQNSELCKACSKLQESDERLNVQLGMGIKENLIQNQTDGMQIECRDAESKEGSDDNESKKREGADMQAQSSIKPQYPENMDRRYCCKVCGKSFCHRASFLKHVKKVENEKDICGVCGKHFESKESLRPHLKTCAQNIQTSDCKFCGKQFKGPTQLEMHTRTHTGEKPYICSVCDRSFAQKGTLMSHMHVHTKEKPYICDVCGKAFARNEYLKAHMRGHTKECVCSMCGQNLRWTQGSGQGPKLCTFCSKSLESGGGLHGHSKLDDKENMTQNETDHRQTESCDAESKAGRNDEESEVSEGSTIQKRHEDPEGMGPKYCCQVCGKSFCFRVSLLNHVKKEETDKDICGVCGEGFESAESLRLHLQSYVQTSDCGVCGKQFSRPQQLEMHMRIHTGEKPYICSVCRKAFSRKGLLVTHMQVHTRASVCSVCGQSFRQCQSLRQSPKMCKTCSKRLESFENVNLTKIDSKLNIEQDQTDERQTESCDSETNVHKSVMEDMKSEETENMGPKYCCQVCSRSFCFRVSLLNHVKKEETDKAICGVCGEGFESAESLRLHLQSYTQRSDCGVCGKQFSRPQQLEMHMRIHTGEKPYICSVCRKAFSQKGLLVAHIQVHTRAHDCSVCGQSFRQSQGVRQNPEMCKTCSKHLESDENLNVNKIDNKFNIKLNQTDKRQPESCDAETNVGNSVREGMKSEETENMDHNYLCKVCSRSFSIRTCFIKHVKRHEMDVKICGVCGKHFESKESLRLHLQTYDQKNDCEVCGKLFKSPYQLEIHMRMHTGEKPYVCSVCGKSFYEKGKLKTHMLIHTGKKTYVCHVCGQSFLFRYYMMSHIKSHTNEKPFLCSVCGKRFKWRACLTAHMRTHTGEFRYRCFVCNKKFHQSSSLKIHLRFHTGEKPYQCNVCGKSFKAHWPLKQHLETHNTGRKHSCSICGKMYRWKESLKKHEKTHRY